MEDDADELMASFASVELNQDAPAIWFVVDVAQQIKSFGATAEFLKPRASRVDRSLVWRIRVSSAAWTTPNFREPAMRSRLSHCSAINFKLILFEAKSLRTA